jgi:hypothetical protein
MRIASKALRFAAAAAGLCLGHAHAHHSYGMFDRCTRTQLEGEITAVQWVNPHIVINLRTRDVDDYRIEWYSLAQLEREGISTETLKTGDKVTITGHAMRDPSLKVLSLLSDIRGEDGWTWANPRRTISETCAAR